PIRGGDVPPPSYDTFSMPDPPAEQKSSLSVPGRSNGTSNGTSNRFATFETGSDEEVRQSRVTFNDDRVNIEGIQYDDDRSQSVAHQFEMDDEHREQWDNKTQFYMGVVSYAVGLGNVWRFPYLCQKNGGGAFLIPYSIMMVLGGLPLFLIELGIGQRLRTGPVGVWNAIHPNLGGIGVSEAVVSYLVALYYNVIITWCLYYFFRSFTFDLPWASCPQINGTDVVECAKSSSPTSYFWNRNALQTSGSIGEVEGFNIHLLLSLIVAWVLIYLCVMKGIKSSGKVMYATATFPYLVTTIFFLRSVSLDGAMEGFSYMFHPDLKMLYDPNVWLDAATQIFYSMGLGFGGLIAFGSYNPLRNNCVRDVKILAFINLATSFYTAVVVFCVLGYMAHNNMHSCIKGDMMKMTEVYPELFPTYDDVRGRFSDDDWKDLMASAFVGKYEKMQNVSAMCDYHKIITEAAEGTGLAFVVFTEAIIKFPFPPIWSFLFFLMLISLGLGSMFGTLEGVITSLNDSHLIQLKKPVLTAILCGSACLIGLIFATNAGQYWVSLFDHFAGSYGLMCVAFMEVIAVIYVYGYERFVRDIEFMSGEKISQYWIFTWRFISPLIMFFLFVTSVISCFKKLPTYFTYDKETAKLKETEYPPWALWIALFMVILAISPLIIVFFIRKFKIIAAEPNIPAASKRLNTTQSTTYMLKSEQSFNRMTESSVSVMMTETANGPERTTQSSHSA
ncbi:hypothetical protein PMAYCL1PPCAC_31152, partial [Pristionchus mayeri]